MKKLLLTICLLFSVFLLYSQDKKSEKKEKKEVEERVKYTTKRTQAPPKIDGLGDDDAWKSVEWGGDFTQREPVSGDAPSQKTAFKILYDAKNLYVLIRAFDTEPDKIVKRMSRRDGFDGDFVEVNIDSYNDKRNAFSFTLTAAGVKGDEYISNNGDNWDRNWNPIWYTKVSSDSEGWLAEMRIPLSQLRFANKASHVWGLQVTRRFFRNSERSNWQYIPQDASGWVHLFGELHGLEGIKPQKQLEIQPYVVAKTERMSADDLNPFQTGKSSSIAYGIDGKIGITSDITLDFSVNPDFGQVEADPSQVNLSAFEVFFRERRPFFIEGSNTLDFSVGNRDNLFYSRRIGRRPYANADTKEWEYSDTPNNTPIAASFKLTGKNKNGFSWGILEAVTPKVKSEISYIPQTEMDNLINTYGSESAVDSVISNQILDTNPLRKIKQQTVEPFSNYFVARVQQEFNKANTLIGAMVTTTNRKLNIENDIENPRTGDDGISYIPIIGDTLLNNLHTNAYSVGVDFRHNFLDRKYYIAAKSFFSSVKGSQSALLQTQTSSRRNYQRPDAVHLSVDSTRTSLKGSGAIFNFGKQSGKVLFQFGGAYNSPGLELNDVGFLRSTDKINQWLWVQYRQLKPIGIFRNYRINFNQFFSWNFGRTLQNKEVNVNVNGQFKNFWNAGSGVNYEGDNVATSDLRGGPSIKYPGGVSIWYWFNTDRRKKVRFSFNRWNYWGKYNYSKSSGNDVSVTVQPSDALKISLSANWNTRRNDQQYVSTQTFTDTNANDFNRYITARVAQKTYSVALRFTYNINPNLSIEYWGQPFAAKGKYSDYKMITNSTASDYDNRFQKFSDQQISAENDTYNIDEDQDGNTDYSLDGNDFNFMQFRSNMVMRWEYKPGSTFFLVWTQSRDGFNTNTDSSFGNSMSDLFTEFPHNIFLMKFTYRFVK